MSRLAVFLILAAIGCADKSTGIVASCPPEGSTLTYDGFGQFVIEEHCLECHSGKESPRLDTLDEVRRVRQSIIHEAVETSNMPEGSGMTLEQREALGEWLACGAP